VRPQLILRFGDFQFDPEAPLLTRASRSLELSPKALQVLAVLVRNAGRVVSKDDLLNIVWPDTAVEEGNLAVHIFALRRALGTAFIETVPKRGYRFAAPVDPADPPHDPCRIAACYVQQQTATGCRRAAAEYGECLRAEPRNAHAKAGLANTLMFRFVLDDLSRNAALPRAKALLDEANQIDPRSADVHLSRSRWLCLAAWRWERAQEELQHALELAGSDETPYVVAAWQGCSLVECGELESGLQRLRWANAACPLSPFISRFLAEAHFLARDFSGCVTVSRKALHLHPHNWLLYRSLGRALTALGEYDHARRCFHRATLLYNAPQTGLLADLAYLEVVAGNHDRARTLLQRLPSSSVSIAQVHAALGNQDRALDVLEQACANRDWSLSALKQDYRLDSLRPSPRYRRVLKHVGI
jgi:DNA-binding winged helix-turn-helix (wHTH) protein/Tfp pilus assembly protein PilF